jgi:hypothetical protein
MDVIFIASVDATVTYQESRLTSMKRNPFRAKVTGAVCCARQLHACRFFVTQV